MIGHLSRAVAAVLLGTILFAGAGSTCFLSASAVPASASGCHSGKIPLHPQPVRPQPANHICCMSRHSDVLLTTVFTIDPARFVGLVEKIEFSPLVSGFTLFVPSAASPGPPPRFSILRI